MCCCAAAWIAAYPQLMQAFSCCTCLEAAACSGLLLLFELLLPLSLAAQFGFRTDAAALISVVLCNAAAAQASASHAAALAAAAL